MIPLFEVSTIAEVNAFKDSRTSWRVGRDPVKITELPSGKVRVEYVGKEALPPGLPRVVEIGVANIKQTVPLPD